MGLVTQLFIQCGRGTCPPIAASTACDAAFNECFIGSVEAETCAKRRPGDGWVLVYCTVHHTGDNYFKGKLI